MSVQDYSLVPGSNTTINGINVGEGCAPANINDAIRQLMADIADGVLQYYEQAKTPEQREIARNNLGLLALAMKDKAAIDGDTTGTLPVNRGGTGGTTQAAAREGLGFTLASGALSRLNESVNHIDSSWVAGVSTIPGFASPKQIADAIAAMVPPSVGVGQKWRKVVRNRGVAYQNTTGRVIQVYLRFHNVPMSFSTSEDGTAWDQLVGNIGSSAMTFILPPGHYYRVSGAGEIGESLEIS